MIVWSFKILIMIVLALIYSFCFEDAVSLSIPIKDAIFVKLRCIIAVLQGLKVEQFPIHLLLAATAPPPPQDGDGNSLERSIVT